MVDRIHNAIPIPYDCGTTVKIPRNFHLSINTIGTTIDIFLNNDLNQTKRFQGFIILAAVFGSLPLAKGKGLNGNTGANPEQFPLL